MKLKDPDINNQDKIQIKEQKYQLPPLNELFEYKGRVKIIELLTEVEELNITDIATKTRLNHNGAKKHLKWLSNNNILIEKKFGSMVLIYKFNDKITQLKMLKLLFDLWNKDLDKEMSDKISKLIEILKDFFK